MARKVVWHVTMSLDGFIAGPDDAMDWASGDFGERPTGDAPDATGFGPLADEVVETAGAFMSGGRLYSEDVGADQVYGGGWDGPVFVLTHHPPTNSKHPNITFLSGDIRDAVDQALRAADGKNLVVAGGSVPRQCIDAGLVDEIVVHLVPVLLGNGVRVYDNVGADLVSLERTALAASGQETDFRFRVRKDR